VPLFVNKNASSGRGSTSDALDEQDVSGLPESEGRFGAFRDFGTPPGSDDSVPGSVPTPPDGFDPDGGDGSGGGPGPVIAVTSGGVTFNLTFDSFAPASFRAGIQQAASILTAMISDQITVNLAIHYTGTGGGANAGPSGGLFQSYSATTAALINHASLGDTIFNALPGGSSIQGQS
jgi:serralysin